MGIHPREDSVLNNHCSFKSSSHVLDGLEPFLRPLDDLMIMPQHLVHLR